MVPITRREAIQLMTAAGAGAVAAAAGATGCDWGSSAQRGPSTMRVHSSKNSSNSAVISVQPLGFRWATRNPFLFCVHHDDRYPAGNEHFGPAASLAGRQIGQDFEGIDGWRMYHGDVVPGFPRHPHRGFETITIVRRGLLDHSDSLGGAARYGGGDVQWMTAGRGILHSEMFPLLHRAAPNPVELFQIWLNLPRERKMVAPYFSLLWRDTLGQVHVRDDAGRSTEVTVVAGAYRGTGGPAAPPDSWASKAAGEVAIWTIKMEQGSRWELPGAAAGLNRSLYFFVGSGLGVDGTGVPQYHEVRLRSEATVTLEAAGSAVELLLLQGRPIDEPVIHQGPFVMNTPSEIRQAYADYHRTGFGGWPWKVDGPVHGADFVRFAKHPDGREERPT